VAAAESGAAVAPHGVDLIDENDAGGLLLGLVEHVADAGGADTDEHFDKIGTRDRKERHLGLAGDGLGEQGLAGAGLAHHEHTPGNAPAEPLELVGFAQEVDKFLDILLGLLHSGDIGEGDLDLVLAEQFGLALAEGHGAALAADAALHLPHEEEKQRDDDEHREAGDEQLRPDALPRGFAADDFDVVFKMCLKP